MEREGGGIFRAVSEPMKLLGAAPDLTKGSAGVAILVFLITLNGLNGMIAFGICHLIAVALTTRDPDITRIMMAWGRTRRARAFYRVKGNKYVP